MKFPGMFLGAIVAGVLLLNAQISVAAAEDEAKNAVAHVRHNGLRRTVTRRRQISAGHNGALIEMIDVKCNQDKGILVKMDFAEDFSGVVYSQGHFNDPRCRYVAAGSNGRSFEFLVPFDGCGSKAACSVCDSIENVLVIQKNELIQEDFDVARKVACERHATGEKTIIFKPFVVDMLEVVDVPTALGGVQCWMDIQRGLYPQTQPLGSVIKIGETLSVLVFLRDQKQDYDLTVRDCWAFDNENYNDKSTAKLQLSDKRGCSRREKLFGSWRKTTDVGQSGATMVLFNNLQAFKFPDRAQVFLKCDVEICRGKCEEVRCGEENLISHETSTKPYTPQYEKTTIAPRTRDPFVRASTEAPITVRPRTRGTTPSPSTFAPRTRGPQVRVSTDSTYEAPTTYAPREKIPIVRTSTEFSAPRTRGTRPPIIVPEPEVNTPKDIPTLSQSSNTNTQFKPNPRLQCYPNSADPRCKSQTRSPHEYLPPSTTTRAPPVTTTTEFVCAPGSRDLRCYSKLPTTPAPCYPGSTDPRCGFRTTQQTPAPCYPGSLDPRCPKPVTTTRAPVTTTRAPVTTTRAPVTTPKPFVCEPYSLDPRCGCFPGSPAPHCSQFRTTTRAPVTTTRAPVTTTRAPVTTTRAPVTTTRAPFTTPKPFVCEPFSVDPRCECFPGSPAPHCTQFRTTPRTPPTYLPPVTTTRAPFTTTTQFVCTPGSRDYRCQPKTTLPTPGPCYPGSTDPRCGFRTTQQTPAPCFPGSKDPRCPQPFTTRPTTAPVTTTTPASCYPGSPDPRCPQPDRPSSTRPPSTYLPPFDFNANRIVRDSAKWDLINDINSLDEHKLFKRSIAEPEKEIISITLNLKGLNLASAA